MAIRERFSARLSNYMSVTEKVLEITKNRMNELARTIEAEMKAEARNYKSSNKVRTGNAAGAIHIEEIDDTHVFVGADIDWDDWNNGGLHLYYMTQGNKPQSGGRIVPTEKKALKLKDGSVRKSVSPYGGRDFIHTIAKRHGG